jgi:hypothetical protein
MKPERERNAVHGSADHHILRPAVWQQHDRYIFVGVSHPSDDPSPHRVFDVRATFDAAHGGWVAMMGNRISTSNVGIGVSI